MPDEKFDEKEREKQAEKSPQEKSWDEKGRSDPLGTIIWALILIWAGVVFLASNMGWLGVVGGSIPGLPGVRLGDWSLVFAGAGVLLLLEAVVRLLLPSYRRPIGGSIFLGLLFLGIGLGDIISWNIIWPLILIALGLIIVLRGAWRR